jgi:hypothetical protein
MCWVTSDFLPPKDKHRAEWIKLSPAGQPPTPRDCGTANLVNNKLYVIGGDDEERDVFVYDVGTPPLKKKERTQQKEFYININIQHKSPKRGQRMERYGTSSRR